VTALWATVDEQVFFYVFQLVIVAGCSTEQIHGCQGMGAWVALSHCESFVGPYASVMPWR
jgi:hypothetical protein